MLFTLIVMNLVQVTKVMDNFTSKVDDFQVLEETVNNAMEKSTSNMVGLLFLSVFHYLFG